MAVNQRKAGTILSYVTLIVTNTVSLFYTPFVIQGLGQRQYGLFGTANSITSYLSLLSFGIAGAYIKFNMEFRAKHDVEGERKLNGMFFTIYTVMSAVVLLIGIGMVAAAPYIFAENYTTAEIFDIQIIMACTIVSMMVSFMFNVVAMALLSYERFVFIRVCMLVSGLATPAANIIAIYVFHGNAPSISICALVISTVTYIIYYVYARKRINLKFIFKGFDKKVVRAVFVFSSFLLLNSITDMITNSTDTLILSVVSGPVAVAIYSVASNFRNYFLTFSTSVSNVFGPQVNKIIATGGSDDELDYLFQKIGRVQCLIVSLILIGFIFIGPAFISIWAGPNYSDAYYIALLLFAGLYIPCFQNVGLEIQKAKNMHKVRSVLFLCVAVLNVIASIPLSIYYGGVGAAFATFVCMFFGNFLFMNVYYHRAVGLNIWKFWFQILKLVPGFIPPIIAGILVMNFFDMYNYGTLLFGILIILVVYIVSIWFLSMNAYEKELVKGPFKKLANKLKRNKA